jgi:adenylate cyclase
VTEPSHAVFLSYASQDAEAAQRICEALRAAGIEVFLDQSELRGGDAWDQKIRREIHDCALFIPIVSANTASRHEGYFRLEWDLADQRTHMIARSRVFVVPVCLDATTEVAADVPESFRRVQWTRLPGGETPRAFVARIKRLLSPELSSLSTVSGAAPELRESVRRTWRSKPVPLAIVAVVVFATLAYLFADKFWISKHLSREQPPANALPVASAGVSASPAVSEKSIAVLPFLDMSEKKDQQYFADGMAEEIIDLLARVPDLRVPARTSSFYFKGKSTKVPEIARELGVAHILEGSIRRSGDRIRVTAQLVRADNGFHLWSQTYDRDLHDVFKVQDDIANAVVQALQITLMGGPLTRLQGGTQNLAAYQLFLRGRSAVHQNSKPSLAAANGYLDQAIQLDPNFALAWVWLAVDTLVPVDFGVPHPKESLERARQLAQQALRLSPELAEPHFVLGYVYRKLDWNWTAAEAEVRQGLSLDPTNSLGFFYLSLIYKTLGRWADSEQQLRLALARDPLSTFAYYSLAETQYLSGHFADAEASIRRLRELAPDFAWTNWLLARTLLAEGKPAAARAVAQHEDVEEYRLCIQAIGHTAEADEALKTLTTKFADNQAYSIAMLYAYRNDNDLALRWLDRAYQQEDSSLTAVVGEPMFRNVVNDPRYKALLRKMNLPE